MPHDHALPDPAVSAGLPSSVPMSGASRPGAVPVHDYDRGVGRLAVTGVSLLS